jgi:type II secretory pathway component HofQ
MRLLAISVSLLLAFQAVAAEGITPPAEVAHQLNAQTLQHRPRIYRRAIRHHRVVRNVAALTDQPASAVRNLPVHVYHLNYVTSKDVAAMIRPMLSKSGSIEGLPWAKTGAADNGVQMGLDSKSGEVLIVADREEVLKKIDRVIAQIDVEPAQVLIEAQIVQVRLDKNYAGVNLGLLNGKKEASTDVGGGELDGAAVRFRPASTLTANGKLAAESEKDAGGVKLGFLGVKTEDVTLALQKYGEVRVLAAPRILTLNKQSADILLGRQLVYQDATVTETGTVKTPKHVNIGTELHVRPFVSSDGMIRLEVRVGRTTGNLDRHGIPAIHTSQITANVLIPNGTTVAAVGPVHNEVVQVPDLLSLSSWISWLVRGEMNVATDVTTAEQLVVLLTASVYKP